MEGGRSDTCVRNLSASWRHTSSTLVGVGYLFPGDDAEQAAFFHEPAEYDTPFENPDTVDNLDGENLVFLKQNDSPE